MTTSTTITGSYVTHACTAGYALTRDEARDIDAAFTRYIETAPKLATPRQEEIREAAFRHAAGAKRNSHFGENPNLGRKSEFEMLAEIAASRK